MGPNLEQQLADIENRFSYHAPNEDAKARHEKARDILKVVASAMIQLVPYCREQSLILTHLEEAMFWANAAIARHHDLCADMEPIQ